MRSTGEVMGIDVSFGTSFAKAELAANQRLPRDGTVFVSMNNRDKSAVVPVVKDLVDLGFDIVATEGTRKILKENGLEVELVLKLHEGRPHVLDWIKMRRFNSLLILLPVKKHRQMVA